MKLVKKTDDYTIYQRRDGRHAVKDANKAPVNGDEKARILAEEGLVAAPKAAAPAEEAPEAPAEEATEAEAPADDSGDTAE